MSLEACTFERLAFISLRFGIGTQVEKTSLLEVELLRRKRRRWAYSFFIWYASRPGIPPKPSIFGRRRHIFFTMRSKDSETTHLLGSGPVLRHNNACVRDVLTALSNVCLNLVLNLFHSYFYFVYKKKACKASHPEQEYHISWHSFLQEGWKSIDVYCTSIRKSDNTGPWYV